MDEIKRQPAAECKTTQGDVMKFRLQYDAPKYRRCVIYRQQNERAAIFDHWRHFNSQNNKIYTTQKKMQQNANPPKITAQAFAHAMRIVRESYPDMPEDRQRVQAARLAAKICKPSKL